MNNSKQSSSRSDDNTMRLVRIETKLAKIMQALGIDPQTGEPYQKKPTNLLGKIFNGN